MLDQTETDAPHIDKYMQRIAWLVVWSAFALFCVVCVGSTLGVYYFLFQSTVSLDATLSVGRGTSVITSSDLSERGVRLQRESLNNRPAQISTDLQSQSTIAFTYVAPDDFTRLIASVTLKNNSVVSLRRATRPRFDWSSGQYVIELGNFEGDMEVLVLGGLERALVVQISTRRGELIVLNEPGRYTISSGSTRVYVANRAGEAVLFSPDRSSNLLIPQGQEAVMFAGRKPVFSPPRLNLLENGMFVFEPFTGSTDGTVTLPGRWGCTNIQREAPRGVFKPGIFEGRPALWLRRAENASSNGETRCRQPFPAPGKVVSQYNYLELETTFLINFQSLSECGVEGSECPMMLHLEYLDVNGIEREWYQGFYYALDPLYEAYKPRCASCIQDHVQVNEKVWYTYETGNLINILPDDARPASITNVEFYASGHQYDVYMSEIALYAGFIEAVPPDVTPPTLTPTTTP